MPLGHLVCCGASVLLLAVAILRLRGTTLVSPLAWSLAGVSSIAIAEVVLFFPPMPGVTSWQSLVRYLAGTLTLLPAISVLGAKVPQSLLWNYIVTSLWIVLIMPAAEVLLLKPQQTFEIYAFGPWMIGGLIFYTAIHYAGTSMTLAGIFVAGAQAIYLAPHLPIWPFEVSPVARFGASLLLLSATLWAYLCASSRGGDEFSRVWRNFKNAYGTAWALRVIQRLDELQVRHNWAIRLSWHGIQPTRDGAAPEEITQSRKELSKAFFMLMLRFFSSGPLMGFAEAELRPKRPAPVSTDASGSS